MTETMSAERRRALGRLTDARRRVADERANWGRPSRWAVDFLDAALREVRAAEMAESGC